MPKPGTIKKLIIILVILLVGLGIYFYLSVFMPIMLAFFTAVLLEPLVMKSQQLLRSNSRLPAVLATFLCFLFFMVSLFFLTVTRLISEILKFLNRLPYYVVEFNFLMNDVIQRVNEAVETLPPGIVSELQRQGELIYQQAILYGDLAVSQLASFIQAIPNFIVLSLVYLITLFLFSLDLPRIKESFYAYFKEENQVKVRRMFQRLGQVFVSFFKAQLVISILIFIISYLGLLLISPRNALLLSIMIWLVDFIPIIGSLLILIPWSLFCLITGHLTMGFQLIFLAALLVTLRRFLEPKIMGKGMGLSSLATLISLYFGFYFLGLYGLIIGPLIIITLKAAVEAELIQFNFKI